VLDAQLIKDATIILFDLTSEIVIYLKVQLIISYFISYSSLEKI
jgi:hypothetical protein